MNSFIKNINQDIDEVEKLLKESMNFYEEDEVEDIDYNEEDDEELNFDNDTESNIKDNVDSSVESYIEHIRKYSLNGLSALCDNPDSEEYQMLKKIFQMCDKKPEKKEITESCRLFGILKESKEVIFESFIDNKKDFNKLKSTLVTETLNRGIDPSTVRLVSEKKIIR